MSSISSTVSVNTNCTECCPRKVRIFCCCCTVDENDCDKKKPIEKKVDDTAKSLFDAVLQLEDAQEKKSDKP